MTTAREVIAQIPTFTPAQASAALVPAALDLTWCREWILRKLHPGGAVCPECGSVPLGFGLVAFWAGRRLQCKSCRKFFTAHSRTILAGVSFGYREIFLLACMIDQGCPSREIADTLGVHVSTVRLWRERWSEV